MTHSRHGLCLGSGLLIASLVVGAAHAGGKKDSEAKRAETISPDLGRCTLRIGDRELKPVGKPVTEVGRLVAGSTRLFIDGNAVRATALDGVTTKWTAKAAEKVDFVFLAADEKIIYFASYETDKADNWRPESPLRVRRLELATGKWLDELPVASEPKPKQTENVQCLLAGRERVIVLTAITADEERDWYGVGELISYCVTCFRAGDTKPAWARQFTSAGKSSQAGAALLWATRSPDKVRPDVQQLAWLGDDLLVCGGPLQDLICLKNEDGKTSWLVERVWDYERSFVGPSVWQHFFYRAGDEVGVKKAKAKPKQGEKKEPSRQQSIVGGPIVVTKSADDHRVFMAVAKGPAHHFEYLAECFVYELNASGQPLAMSSLPRMVRGGQYEVTKEGLVWACQAGALVSLGCSQNRHRFIGGGPGGPDLLCRVDWYRQLAKEEPKAWLTSDPAGDPVGFGSGFAFRVRSGGYVADPMQGVYHFPITMIDLKTGVTQSLTLNVPYTGKLPEPTSNYSQSKDPDGRTRWQVFGPYMLAVTILRAEDSRLRITLGMEKWTRTLDFDLGAITK